MVARRRLVVIGAGGHAREVIEAVRAAGADGAAWDLLGVVADVEPADPAELEALGVTMLGPVSILAEMGAGHVVAVGDRAGRRRLAALAVRLGSEPVVIRHPAAVVGRRVSLGPGCYVAAGAVLTTNVVLAEHAHVNVGATVSHDARVGAFSNVGPGCHLAGRVAIGAGVDLGAGVVVIPDRTVGDGAVVGAGATVVRDVPPHVTAVGTPARVLRTHPA